MAKLFRREKQKERKFCGWTITDMETSLYTLCKIENDTMLTEQETEAVKVGVQCISQIMSLMEGGKRIEWDN